MAFAWEWHVVQGLSIQMSLRYLKAPLNDFVLIFLKKYFSRVHLPTFNVSDNTGQFKIVKKSYTQQFSQIYFARLQSLRPLIIMQSGGKHFTVIKYFMLKSI